MTVIHAPAASASGEMQGTLNRSAEMADLSGTIEVARVVLVIGLVFLHYFAYPNSRVPPFEGFDPNHHQVATFVNSFVLFFFFSAVPLLSTISGWLFFGFSARPWEAIRRRIGKRGWSLFVPLVIWNLGALAIAFALRAVAPTSSLLGPFGIDFAHFGLWDGVDAVLGLTRLPVAFQFWFVRDLFVTVLVSPLLWLMLRHAPLPGAAVLCLAWIADFTFFGLFIRTDVLFFFYLGALARLRGVEPRVGWNTTKLLLLVYAVLMALRALAPLAFDPSQPDQREMLDLFTRLARPLGVVACWGLCLRLAATAWGEAIGRYGGFAFFLHAAHFPLIIFVKFMLWRLVPAETDAWMIAHYAASVAMTVAVAALGAAVIFRISPRLYGLVAGGRRLV